MRSLVMTGAAVLAACGPGTKTGDCEDMLLPGDLVITEVFADSKAPPGGSGTDDGKEWFEVYNATDRPVELKGLTVTHSRPDGSKAKSHVMDSVTVAPGQYLTLGNTAPDLLPAYVDYGYGADLGDFYNADGGKLALACGSKEIDSAGYDTVNEGHSRQLTAAVPPDYTLNDDPTMWCEASASEFDPIASPGNFGTPGAESDCTPIQLGQCNDGGAMRNTMAPAPGDLVITEVMPKPSSVSATVGQWFEVLATRDVDLNGVVLDRANDTASGATLESPDCMHLAAGSYAVFARSADTTMNGGLTTMGTFPFSINPSTTPDIQLTYAGAVIDAVTWTTSASGASLSLDPDFLTSTGNDDAMNFCNGVAVYNGNDKGTPGAANAQCPSVAPAGMCDDGNGFRPIVKPTAGQLVITEFLANPATTPVMDGTTDADKEWFEITNTGAAAFDLNELGIANGAAVPTPTPVQSSDCISVAPAGFALFARSKDAMRNAGLPDPDVTFAFSLTDSGVNAGVQIFDGATLLDGVKWTGVSAGKALGLSPDHFNTTDNDTAAVTAGIYCLATSTYGDNSNTGTPKAANPQCP